MTAKTIPAELAAPLFNPATFGIGKREKAHDALRIIRRDYPLAQAFVPGYDPHWIVSKYKDVREILRRDNIFHSGDRSKSLVPKAGEQLIHEYTGGEPSILRTLVHMDGEEHAAHRGVTAARFMPQELAKLEPKIAESARRWVDLMASKAPECEFADEIAFRYPLEVVLDLTGVPREDHPQILKLAQWLFNFADPDLMRPGADPSDPQEVVKTWDIVYSGFKKYYDGIIQDRRTCPRGDIATVLANAKIDGCPMREKSLISYFIILSTAGHDTTAATTATAMWYLAENPDLLAQLKGDLALVPAFVEEAIRWTSPVQHFIRSAAEDFELSGQLIKKDDLVYLSYLSANFDEEMFEDPYTFKVDRRPNRHITFGVGNHICLGQHLARLELRAFWNELLPRLESVELAGEAKMSSSEFVCGPKSVPIRYKMS